MLGRIIVQGLVAAMLVATVGAGWQSWRLGADVGAALERLVRVGRVP